MSGHTLEYSPDAFKQTLLKQAGGRQLSLLTVPTGSRGGYPCLVTKEKRCEPKKYSNSCAEPCDGLGLVLLTPLAAGVQQEVSADGPGAVRWFGLLTEDAAAARAFYADLFGWQTERTSSGGYVAMSKGQPMAGITQIGRSVPEVNESTWLVGVVVSDLRESVAAARRLGAQVLRDVSRTEGFAQWAVIEDPQGAQRSF